MTNNECTPTSKNDLEVDAISRAQAQTKIEMNASRYTIARERGGMGQVEWSDQLIKVSDAVDIIRHLPSVTPQEPQAFKWCTDCREYDQEKHCCHRYSKVIRDTVTEIEQEPRSEWEQDHEILKAYSDGANEVLDKIRAEIEQKCCITVGRENDPAITLFDVLQIIDKYKGEREDKE